ncbi:MAG: hypothetical protein ABSF25_18115 [Bryobacteraceae bacterium]
MIIQAVYAQSSLPSQCVVSSAAVQVRAEGLAERIGDIVFQCSNAKPGTVLSGNLSLFLPTSATNRVDSNGMAADAALSVDYGSGFTPTGITGQVGNGTMAFNGFSVTVPASGSVNLKISGIRLNMYQLGAAGVGRPVSVWLSVPFPVNQSQLVVAFPLTSLYTNSNDVGVSCYGSALPSVINVSSLFAAGTAFSSTRATGGFAGAFSDPGTRFLIGYTGMPANASIYMPDLIAGSDALVPTAAGDLGGTQSGGRYVPGSGTLLLARVPGADATGAGGQTVALPTGAGPVTLDSASAVPLTNGAGYAVYQVVDSNPSTTEIAQFPAFYGIPSESAPGQSSVTLSYAPVSNVMTASTTAPVPRFANVTPASDCGVVGDCGASYFPQLAVTYSPMPMQFTVAAGAGTSSAGYISLANAGGGILGWKASIAYTSGSGWLALEVSAGVGAAGIRVFVEPQGLTPGTYQANILVDAGPYAGSQTLPVTLTVQAPSSNPSPPPPVQTTVVVASVVNAATFAVTPLVPGSLGTLFGSNLAGTDVAVTFDSLPATLLYAGAGQINFQVPAALGNLTSAAVVTTVDGVESAPVTVALAPAGPSIFAHGILNQDNTPNAAGAGATGGSIIQIFATGIPASATVSAQIADQTNLVPVYAGPAPTLTGIQQVNVAVPGGLAPGSVPLVLCATVGSEPYCSAGYALFVQ